MRKKLLVNVFLAMLLLSYMGSDALAQGLADIMPCQDGQTRPCGSSVGVCEKGVSACQNQLWGPCEGGVLASDEICNDGLDNDCNGLIDDCGFNMVSVIMIGSGCVLLVVALVLSRMEK
jgi:hypothetical protein